MLRTALSVTLCVTLFPIALAPSANGQTRTGQGAVVGGATGAVIGGIIGHQNHETPEGALIGGAVGAIAGGLIGRSQENQIARDRYNQQQAYNQGRYAQQQVVMASGVNMNDVISMSRSGLSDQLIISQVNTKGVQRRLEVSEIITMHQQGVSDYVISAMQAAPLATQVAAPYAPQQIVTQPSTVIVREQPVYYNTPVITETYYRPVPVHVHGHSHYYAPRGRF
jgi:YMGG-like Gly-zipper